MSTRALLRRLVAWLVVDDPRPGYSPLDRLDGLTQRPGPSDSSPRSDEPRARW